MKNTFLLIIAAAFFFFILKTGKDSADSNNETLTFFETLERGFKLMFKPLPDKVETVETESNFSSFSEIQSYARGMDLMKDWAKKRSAKYGEFEKEERRKKALDELSIRGTHLN